MSLLRNSGQFIEWRWPRSISPGILNAQAAERCVSRKPGGSSPLDRPCFRIPELRVGSHYVSCGPRGRGIFLSDPCVSGGS